MIKKNLDLFFYWMNERHRIYLARESGKLWPWTKDKILQEYKFTNVYRNLDAVSKKLHAMVDMTSKFHSVLFFKVCLFRMFNWPPTYNVMRHYSLDYKWDTRKAKKVLHDAVKDKTLTKVFTGAYIITNNGIARSKIDVMCEAVGSIYSYRKWAPKEIYDGHSIEHAVYTLCKFPMVGRFIAYELATDLRWTGILEHADDIMEWANPGPGAKRGLNRIYDRDLKYNTPMDIALPEMKELLAISQKRGRLGSHMEPLEMRDIEHSLCEFDKYMRVKNGEGRPRSKYKYRGVLR